MKHIIERKLAFPTVRLHAVCTEIWGALVAHAGPAAAGGA
jgi:hypothetical protein